MTWVGVGIGTVTAATSMYQQDKQQKAAAQADKADMLANASNLEMSPWTGFKGGVQGAKNTGTAGDVAAAGIQGGMNGALFGKQFQGKPKAPQPTPTPQAMPTTGSTPWSGMDTMRKPDLYSMNKTTMQS